MGQTVRTFLYIIGASMILTIIFIKAGKESGVSGGQQASKIINETATGISKIITSATGG